MTDVLCGVYKISSRKTGHYYIGSAQDLKKRKARHLKSLENGTHHNSTLQKIYARYGEDNLRFTVVQLVARDKAYVVEDRLLKRGMRDDKCVNIGCDARGGDNLTLNPKRDRIVAKMTESMRRKTDSMTKEERVARFGLPGELNGMYGKTHNAEARKKISAANLGQSRNLGVKRSAETKALYSKLAKERAASPEYVNSFAGKHHSEETRKVLSEQAKARYAAGARPRNTRRVKVGKKRFASVLEASQHVGVVPATIINRIRSKNYPDYVYLD